MRTTSGDTFNEKLLRKKKSPADRLCIIGIFVAGFISIYSILMNVEILHSVFIILIAAVFFAMYYALISLNVEYEYAVTNGELDIDKIIAQRRRKNLVTVDSKDFEYFAPLNSSTRSVYDAQDYAKKINAYSSPDAKGIYFAYYIKNGQKIRIAFQPTERMIEDFKLNMPRSMFHAE